MNSQIEPVVVESADPVSPATLTKRFKCDLNSNRLIVRYKTIIKEAKVEYGDLLNYTFAITENRIDLIHRAYRSSDAADGDRRRMVNSVLAILEFAFFAYSASPKVNHTIRMCRMIATSVNFLIAHGFSSELKHLLFKFVHDNVLVMLEKNRMSFHRELESLYLLIVLSRIGREYWLPEQTIATHFLIRRDDSTGAYSRTEFLNHFSITVLLTYIKNKVRYDKLRIFIEGQAIAKLEYVKAHCLNDAEALMLFLDLIVCPYVAPATKAAAGKIFGLDAAALADVQSINGHWFTAWGDKFDLAKELDAKRSREVY